MRHSIIAVLMVILLVLAPVSAVGLASGPTQPSAPVAAAPALVSCTDINLGQQVRIKCTAAGVVVLNTVVDLPQVEVTLPGQTVTVKVPLPAETETVRVPVPGGTKTVEVPGPTQTVTVPVEVNGPTETVTVRPGEPTAAPSAPTETVTTTVTPDPRQNATDDATIEPAPEDDDTVVTIPGVDLNPAEAVGIGTLALIIVAALILLGMYAGYYMGYKDSDKAEAKFYRSLLGK